MAQFALEMENFHRAEVKESDFCYLLNFALGSTQRDELSLKIVNNELVISSSGKKPVNQARITPNFSFTFPCRIDAELARAAYLEGAIQVLIPKRICSKERAVQVERAKTGFWIRLMGGQNWTHCSDSFQEDYLPIHTQSKTRPCQAAQEIVEDLT